MSGRKIIPIDPRARGEHCLEPAARWLQALEGDENGAEDVRAQAQEGSVPERAFQGPQDESGRIVITDTLTSNDLVGDVLGPAGDPPGGRARADARASAREERAGTELVGRGLASLATLPIVIAVGFIFGAAWAWATLIILIGGLGWWFEIVDRRRRRRRETRCSGTEER